MNKINKILHIEKYTITPELQELIALRQIDKEENIQDMDIVFLDRSLIDINFYTHFYTKKRNKVIDRLELESRYHKVFILDTIPLKLRERKRGDFEGFDIIPLFVQEYISYGYSPVLIPLANIEDRVSRILKNIY